MVWLPNLSKCCGQKKNGSRCQAGVLETLATVLLCYIVWGLLCNLGSLFSHQSEGQEAALTG